MYMYFKSCGISHIISIKNNNKFIALNAYLKEKEKSEVYDLSFHSKKHYTK